MTEKKAKLSRRNFLLTVGAGGAATAAAIVTSKSSAHREKRQGQACDARLSRHRARRITTTAPPRSRRAAMLLTRKATGQRCSSGPPVARTIRRSRRRSTAARSSSARASPLGAGARRLAAAVQHDRRGRGARTKPPARSRSSARSARTARSAARSTRVVQNGVWIRQEPVFDSPINLGAHCAKGASIREHGITHDSHRLKYPMKLEGGKWKKHHLGPGATTRSRRSCSTIRKESGPDALFLVGSSKHNNEQAELLRKWVRLWGTNNTDHQARICHSTTVAGVGQDLGLRRDDQLVQRRAELEVACCSSARTPPRRTRCRCCTRCTPRRTAPR